MKIYTRLSLVVFISFLSIIAINAQTINKGTIAVAGWLDSRGYGFDSDGNQYVAGAFTGGSTVTFPGGTVLTNNGSYDGYLAKFNAAGVVQWIKSFTGTSYQEIQNINIVGNDIYMSIYCRGISTIDGQVFDNTAPGNFPNTTNLLILKYNAAGVLQWSRSLVCNKNIYGDVVVGNNYVAVAGSFGGNLTMGGITLDTVPTGVPYSSDVFLALLNASTGAVMSGLAGGSSSSDNSKSAYWSSDNTLKVLLNPGASFSISGQVFSTTGSGNNLILNYSVNGNNLALTSSKVLEQGYVELYPGESGMYYSIESFYNNVTVSGTHYSAPASGSVLRVYDANDTRTSYKVFNQTIAALVGINGSLYLAGKIEKSGTIGTLNYSIAGFNYETFVAEADNSGGVATVVQTFGNGSNYGQFIAPNSFDGTIGVLSQITPNTTFGGFTYSNTGNAFLSNTVLFHAVTCTSPTVTPSQTVITSLDGSNISVSVNTTGSNPKTINWYKDGALLAGETQPELSFLNAKTTVTGIYKATVSNACGSVTSTGINITINGQDGPGTVTGMPSITTTSIVFPSPKVRARITQAKPVLTFPGLAGATSYCIKLSQDSTLTTSVKSVCGLSTPSYMVNVTAPGARIEVDGQVWYYQVAGVDAAGYQSQWSTTQSFEVESGAVTGVIGNKESSMFLIYPNPASEVITISNADGIIMITDVLGTTVYSGSDRELNLSTFPKGLYFVRSGSKILKLIKE